MTVQTSVSKVSARGNGVSTVFNFPFQLPNNTGSQVRVSLIDASGHTTVLSRALYSLSINANLLGGSVTYPLSGSALLPTATLVMERVVSYQQLTALSGQSGFFPDVVEAALDNLEYQIQQIVAGVAGAALALTFPVTDVSPITVLPPAAARANQYLGFDSQGNPVALAGTGSGIGTDLSTYLSTATTATTPLSFAARAQLMLSVKDFGAVGNGVTDDTAAIQAAVTAAGAVIGSGSVYFPPGLYKITAQINVLRACHIYAQPFTATIYFGAQNINGFVIGDGTAPTAGLVGGTHITGLQFGVLSGVAAFTSGACILANAANFIFVSNVSIQGKAASTILWNGIELVNSLEWTIDRPLISNVLNNGIRATGIVSATCGDGRIESPECTGCGAGSLGAAIYFGNYTGAITVDSCIMDSNYGWGIEVDCTQAAGVGANYFIIFPDIEASLPNAPPGAIYVKQGTAQIVGGWLGGTAGLQVDALGSSVTMQGVIVQANGGAVVNGAACSFLDCDFAGPASVAGPTGITLNAGASDTNIVGGHIRQWNTEGIKFVGAPARCTVLGVSMRSNGVNLTNTPGDINTAAAPTGTTTPTPTPSTGAFTTVSASIAWTKPSDRFTVDGTLVITTNNTAAGFINVPLPFTPVVSQAGWGFVQQTGKACSVVMSSNGNAIIRLYDGTYPGADGTTIVFGGNYRT